jgi:hypothetical protein
MGKLTRRELYERVWRTPMRTPAKEFQISDVGLKKICNRHDVPTPGVGYWAKVAHGKKVKQAALPTKTQGERDIIVIEPEQRHMKGNVDDQWLAGEHSAERRIQVEALVEQHSLIQALFTRMAKEKSDDWLVPPHGFLDVRLPKPVSSRDLNHECTAVVERAPGLGDLDRSPDSKTPQFNRDLLVPAGAKLGALNAERSKGRDRRNYSKRIRGVLFSRRWRICGADRGRDQGLA